ncbi:flagellar hook protein FlgE [Crassaminicella profunda]|uniref:flagellar hook protein FlgE n=1 Tax=Crassaminicella profunda TaxID=1286698 RepID=UPI001CA67307|nr:flagellar hook protein FlgE [Crassaminicella profunda]QZY56755.1 flagellar hook protein FlgE [Crassaminicella profunda]
MMRSMFSAVSALSAHQMKMDIIGNNIANVNTVAFKGSRVTFKETFNQTIKGASGSGSGRGGTNPMQVGLGVDVGAVDVIHRRGTPERTDNPTDLMINGEGFFMVSDDSNYLNRYYTRAGNFVVDDYGNLVTQDGMKVLGYMADETGRLKSSIEGIKIDKSTVYPPQATKPSDPPIPGEEIVTFTGNLDSDTKQLNKLKKNDSDPDPKVIGATGEYAIYNLDTERSAAAKHPVYSQINKDLSGALAKETTVEVYDDFGNVHEIKMLFTKRKVADGAAGKESEWQVDAFYLDENGAMLQNGTSNDYDTATGLPKTAASTMKGYNGFAYGKKGEDAAQSFTLKFDENGKVIGDTKMSFRIGTDLTKGAGALDFEMDLEKLTQFQDDSNADPTYVKGYKQGALSEYAINENGEITGVFSNGKRRVLGRIAIANFKNPAGLQKTQSNMYVETRNSGKGVPGKPGTNGFAQLNPGNLEMANVDLGREFTQMITTQRGFQANSKVITTTDEMLQELVNLKR